jgi:hypothetical protein
MMRTVTLVLSAAFLVLATTGAALAVTAIHTLAAGRGRRSAEDDFARRVHGARRAALWRYARWWLLCAAVWLAAVLVLRFAYDPGQPATSPEGPERVATSS